MTAKRRAQRKTDGPPLLVSETDLLGILREHGHQLRDLKEEVAAARLDLRMLRADFLSHAPDARTHEPATAGDPTPPAVVPPSSAAPSPPPEATEDPHKEDRPS